MWESESDRIATGQGRQMYLILGASDSGKTTFAIEFALRLAQNEPVAFVDADIGQSRIGPPTTIGWSLLNAPQEIFSQFDVQDIFFVGSFSPVGHLLQFSAALIKCVQHAAAAARIVIIDTPGFVADPSATSLWWAVQDILQPTKILILQRNDELKNFIEGVKGFDSKLVFFDTPPVVPFKSMPQRQAHRQQKFDEYFRDSSVHRILLRDITIQARADLMAGALSNRISALRDSGGKDMAIGLIIRLDEKENSVYIKAPPIDISKLACIIIGDVMLTPQQPSLF